MCRAFTFFSGLTTALFFSLGTCIVQIQSVRVNFACRKGHFNLSAEAIINVRNARLCARCAKFLLKIKNFLCLVVWQKGLHFWKESETNSRCYWRSAFSCQILFQQRKMRISWRLCDNSEIQLRLWEIWSLLVCSETFFMLQEVVKTTKTDKTRSSCSKKRWTWYPTNNCYLMSLFN